jgi:hypothetical protein
VLIGGGFTTEGLADEGGGGARREREKPYGSPVEGHKLDANGLDGGGERGGTVRLYNGGAGLTVSG